MPYHIMRLPGTELFKVYSEDGKPHSKKGLSREMAEKQMTALNIAHARKMGADIPMKTAKIEYVKMPVSDYVKEHKMLVKVLDLASAEAKKQRKEIKDELGMKI
jgi:hypothetical protein